VERPLCLFQQQTRKTHTSSDFIQCSTFIYATGSNRENGYEIKGNKYDPLITKKGKNVLCDV
jgi:hypothetical protein